MKHATLLLLAALLPLSLEASELKVTITRVEASELYVALSTADAGLAPSNAVAAADNINMLRPIVEALDKGKVAYQRSVRAALKAADPEAAVEKLNADLEAKGAEQFTLKLQSLAITDDELTATKLKPSALATLRRWLVPPPKS